MRTSEKLQPFYFGPRSRRLFGCYHEPPSQCGRGCAVLICQPIGHEYINSHRALRQLAARLAEAGFPTLRFDYYGCGDSSGNAEDAEMFQWLEDVSIAINELRRRSDMPHLCLLGLRLGGAFSALVAAERKDIESLILWDPVVNGAGYLEELRSLQSEMMRFRPKPRPDRNVHRPIELLGFPLARRLAAAIENINLMVLQGNLAANTLLIESKPAEEDGSLTNPVPDIGFRVERQALQAPQIWQPNAEGSLLVPAAVLRTVVSWMTRIHA